MPTILILALSPAQSALSANLTGLWDFANPADPGAATVGNDLTVGGSPLHHASLPDDHGTSLEGVLTTEGGLDSWLTAYPDLPANGGGVYVNQYSIVVDLFTPADSRGTWRPVFQTNASPVGNDADYWVRNGDSRLGVSDLGYSSAPLDETSWTRLVITVDLTLRGGDAKTYLDGNHFFTHPGDPAVDGRLSLYAADATNVLHFFSDNTAAENPPMHVGMIALFEGILTSEEAAALGPAGAPVVLDPDNANPVVAQQAAGPLATTTGTSESFVFSASDPDGDPVQVQADWGDGSLSAWSPAAPSGSQVALDHSWSLPGSFALRARARDDRGGLSNWEAIQTVEVTGPPIISVLTPPYLQNVRTDGIVIMCETGEDVTLELEFGPDPHYGVTVVAERVASGGGTWFHRAILTGLQAGTHYHYRFLSPDGSPLTGDAEFETAPDGEVDFRFSFWSDSQGHNRGAWTADPLEPTTSMMKHMARQEVAFGFTTGDLAEDGNSYSDTRSFYLDRVARFLGGSAPWFAAWGNHDSGNPNAPLRLASDMPSRYREGFSPGHGSFSFTYANCFFVCIDHFYQNEITNGWLHDQLSSPAARNARFRFLGIHVPPYCERWIDGDAALRNTLVPLLERYDVDFCFSGHTHEYQRGELNHVHYVISGGGSWLDHTELIVRDWEHMFIGGAHDLPSEWARERAPGVLAPGRAIAGGLVNEYALITIRDEYLRLDAHGFHADGSEIGIVDSLEFGSDPGPDSDGDGMRDAFEAAHGLDPGNAEGIHGAEGDFDGDGQSNLAEMIAGTLPGDPRSLLRILAITELPDRTFDVAWSSTPGKRYRIMLSYNLIDWAPWSEAGEVVVVDAAAGSSTNRVIPRPGTTRAFARVEVVK